MYYLLYFYGFIKINVRNYILIIFNLTAVDSLLDGNVYFVLKNKLTNVL